MNNFIHGLGFRWNVGGEEKYFSSATV